jgi:hypothetical protein
MLLLDSRIFPH